tara:strand:- start:869 stop:2665 length:1797 start_codon:yes stop_codon:yes gene_type:complete
MHDEKQSTSFLFSRGWKILFRYLLRFKREVVILSILGVISAFANAMIPYLVGQFFDGLVTPEKIIVPIFDMQLPVWGFILIIWVIVQAIANIVDWVNDRTSSRVGIEVNTEYPTRAVAYMLTLPLSFHKEQKTGDTWDKIMRAGGQLSQIIERVVINLTPQLLSVAIGLGIAYTINPLLASILVVGVVIYISMLVKIVPPIVKLQKDGQKAWNTAYGKAYDAVSNYQTIKQSGAEEYEHDRVRDAFVGKASVLWYKVEKIWASISFFQRVTVLVTQLGIFILAAAFVIDGKLSIGSLIALNGYALMVFGPFIQLGYNWQVIQNGIIAIERADDILNLPVENTDRNRTEKLEKAYGNVSFRDVFFSYVKDSGEVLKNINFDVKAGEVVAFVGESGVGKSTAIDLISGYYTPQKGKVLVDGKDISTLDLYSLRKHIAIVPQEVVLFNDTIEMNIKYGKPNATTKEIEQVAELAHCDVFINTFPEKYNQLVGERGVKLSVGQKQRVAIARAMLRDPKILILDEPTSALDIKTEQFIQESLKELMKGRTTFIIAHRLSTVRQADKIFVFKEGSIVEKGTHEDLVRIEGGIYQRLYNLHIGLT